jgi:hypothetical protein
MDIALGTPHHVHPLSTEDVAPVLARPEIRTICPSVDSCEAPSPSHFRIENRTILRPSRKGFKTDEQQRDKLEARREGRKEEREKRKKETHRAITPLPNNLSKQEILQPYRLPRFQPRRTTHRYAGICSAVDAVRGT